MRAIKVLLTNSFLMSVSFFAFIPFLSAYITGDLALSAGIAGLVLMIRQLSQQGTSFISGMLGDRFDYRKLISLGMLIRGIGFFLFAFCTTTTELIIAAIISSIGGSLFEPISKAAISLFTPSEKRGEVFALDKIVRHSGIISAGVLGGVLFHLDFVYTCLVCGGIFVIAGIITFFLLPQEQVLVEKQSFKESWQRVKSDGQFMYFTICMIGFWFMFMQLYLAIPLHAADVFNNTSFVSGLFIVYGVIVIALQIPLQKGMKHFERLTVIKFGLATMAIGMLIVGFSSSFIPFWSGFVLFAIGIMLVEPTSYEYTSEVAPPQFSGSYFGFALMAMAVGGGISQGAGGWIYDHLPELNWILCLVIGLLASFGIHHLQGKNRKTKELISAKSNQ
ncbi:MDR family MFS transporter [Ornithinibacillus sp. 4-3]|uniref:MDR family MFS transporter n=1 Tax=Ornithinibacillus sp. 4-3 TaxID=3231488 RepID=A0AB39HJQ4_9BACI